MVTELTSDAHWEVVTENYQYVLAYFYMSDELNPSASAWKAIATLFGEQAAAHAGGQPPFVNVNIEGEGRHTEVVGKARVDDFPAILLIKYGTKGGV